LAVLPDPVLSRAVLIGTGDFTRSDALPPLPAVSDNLADLRRALTDPGTGTFARNHCTVVQDPETPSSFMQRLRAAANQATDLLLVYYTGHGIRYGFHEQLYLAVRQTDPENPDESAVPFEWVRNAIVHSPARTKLLILDCCYSGMALGTMSAGTVEAGDVAVRGTSVLTSSGRTQVSFAPKEDTYSAFTGELISLLANGSPIAGEPLTVDVAYRHLYAALARRNLPLPKRSSGDTSNDLLLRRTKAPPPTEAAAPVPEPVAPPVQQPSPEPNPAPAPAPAPTPPRLGPVESPAWPAPVPGPVAAPPVLTTRQRVSRRITRVVTLCCFLFFADMGIGSLIGLCFARDAHGNPAANDPGLAIFGLVVAGAILVPAALRARRQRGQPSARPAPLPPFPGWLTGLLSVLLIAALGLSGTAFVLVMVSPVPGTSGAAAGTLQSSGVALSSWIFLLSAQGALGAGRGLVVLGRHSRRQGG
jgi:hypothetical protein